MIRQGKDSKFDSRARVAEVDYAFEQSLTSALIGHDVVVNTLGAIPRDIYLRLIVAAVAAHVQRFLARTPPIQKQHNSPSLATSRCPGKYLQKKSKSSGGQFTYTLPIIGFFFDLGLKNGFLLNLTDPEAELSDGGDGKFSTTALSGVGKATSGIVQNLAATKNRTIFIREAGVSQNQLLKISNKNPATKAVSTEELERNAFAELGKLNPNTGIFVFNSLRRAIFGEGFAAFPLSRNCRMDLLM